ncbi:MAG: creatininase family protein, partial [Armatimonadota bacterium]|nr:creatininase family protein [Armatimonadota bacterium]
MARPRASLSGAVLLAPLLFLLAHAPRENNARGAADGEPTGRNAMLPKYEEVCYELLRPEQVKERRQECPIAYIPAGSLEWHSFHLPLGTDALKAHAICCEAALRHGGVVLPPFYQGLVGQGNWGPQAWSGYTLGFNTPEMFEAAVLGMAKALVAAGWKVIVGVTGHDVAEQRDAMARAIQTATAGKGATGFALMEGELRSPGDGLPFGMDHAAAWETSCLLYAYPKKVDLQRLRVRTLSADEQFEMKGPEGMGGRNPLKYASAALGRQIVETMGERIGARARAELEKQAAQP